MTDIILRSVQTGDGFNPVIVFAIAGVCLAVAIYLLVTGKRK